MPQLEVGESSRLQMFPCWPSDLTSITKVEPWGLEDMLEEVYPRGRICNNMFQEKESSTLQSKQLLGA